MNFGVKHYYILRIGQKNKVGGFQLLFHTRKTIGDMAIVVLNFVSVSATGIYQGGSKLGLKLEIT